MKVWIWKMQEVEEVFYLFYKDKHPEWFNENGRYIGLGGKEVYELEADDDFRRKIQQGDEEAHLIFRKACGNHTLYENSKRAATRDFWKRCEEQDPDYIKLLEKFEAARKEEEKTDEE